MGSTLHHGVFHVKMRSRKYCRVDKKFQMPAVFSKPHFYMKNAMMQSGQKISNASSIFQTSFLHEKRHDAEWTRNFKCQQYFLDLILHEKRHFAEWTRKFKCQQYFLDLILHEKRHDAELTRNFKCQQYFLDLIFT